MVESKVSYSDERKVERMVAVMDEIMVELLVEWLVAEKEFVMALQLVDQLAEL